MGLFNIAEQDVSNFINDRFDLFDLHEPADDNVADAADQTNHTELREGAEEGVIDGAQWQ